MRKWWIIGVVVVGLVSCQSAMEEKVNAKNSHANPQKDSVQLFHSDIDFVRYLWACFENKELNRIVSFQPDSGIVFSTGPFITPGKHVLFNAANTIELHKDRFFGMNAASGDSIVLSANQFIYQFILPLKLSDSKLQIKVYDDFPIHGSETSNAIKMFPKSQFVELYLPPSQPGYLDWKACVFVVSKNKNKNTIQAIIYNQWNP